MHRSLFLLLLIPALLLSGCAALRPEPPQVQLAGLTISDLSLTHANFMANLSLYNPNSDPLDIEGLEFALFLGDVRVSRGVTAKAFTVPAEQTGSAALRLSTSFIDLFRLTQQFKGLDEVPFRIAGEVKVGGPGFLWVTVPINSEGTIPLAGALGKIFSAPDDFWNHPGRLLPDKTTVPPSAAPERKEL